MSEEAARKAVEEIQHRQRQDKEVSPVFSNEVKQENPQPKSSVTNAVVVPTSCLPTSTTELQQRIRSTKEVNK